MFGLIRNFFKGVKNLLTRTKIEEIIKNKIPNYCNDTEMYKIIQRARCLYKGRYDAYHLYTYKTIGGQSVDAYREDINMAYNSCNDLSKLIFTDKVEINASSQEVPELDDYINMVLDDNQFLSNMQELTAGSIFALGGGIVLPFPRRKPNKDTLEICIDYIKADYFYPISYDTNKIWEGLFISYYRKKEFEYTIFTWIMVEDDQYVIKYEAYRYNKNKSATQVSIKEIYPKLDEIMPLGINIIEPLFTYIKPAIDNNKVELTPLGIPIFENALDTLKQIAVAYNTLYWELKYGKKQIYVPVDALKEVAKSNGQTAYYYDVNNPLYQGFKFDDGKNEVKESVVTLRIDDLRKAVQLLLDIYAMQLGLDSGYFNLDAMTGSSATATQVISELSRSFRTKKNHERNIGKGMESVINRILDLTIAFEIPINDKGLTLTEIPDDLEITIKFDDSIITDDKSDREEARTEVTTSLRSTESYLKDHRNLTEEEIKEEMLRIQKDNPPLFNEDIEDDMEEDEEEDLEPESEE